MNHDLVMAMMTVLTLAVGVMFILQAMKNRELQQRIDALEKCVDTESFDNFAPDAIFPNRISAAQAIGLIADHLRIRFTRTPSTLGVRSMVREKEPTP